ncbi:xyloglucan O-acetyltransferase 3-like [Coffea arabica]|uniref:Xyloglucan O-acetyltransferase 3-like n=1 Tax=Coffea arabica TaxID=13443 RepID=A0A6P6TYM1_COFAR
MNPTLKLSKRMHEHNLTNKVEYLNLVRRPSLLIYSLCFTIWLSFCFLFASNTLKSTFEHGDSDYPEQRNSLNQPGNGRPETEKCDLSKGRWTQDARGPLYTNFSCKTLPYQRNCFLHGRMDRDFLQWRWKPDECELPVFNPRSFLNIVKGKTMAFIGDSLARNHMNSLLCLLSEEETPHEVYREDEEGKTIIWHLPRNNFTIMVLWSPFLVSASEMAVNGTETGGFHLHLDKIDESWVQKLPALDYAILSATNWFFRPNYVYEGGHFLGCIYCSDPNVTHLGPDIVIQGAFRLALKSINDCNSCSRIVTLLRTFSPSQFENGTWNTGGTCKRTRPFAPEEINNGGLDLVYRNAQLAEIDNARKLGEEKGRAFDVIDVTEAMLMRPDGHPGLHWDNRWNKGLSDCLHWCLPGPVDTWNEFLLELLQRHSSFLLALEVMQQQKLKN